MLKEIKMNYDPAEHMRWINLDREAFPTSYRFTYCHHETGETSTKHGVIRPHYYGEAFVVRHFLRLGLETYHERYQLQKNVTNRKSPYYQCNRELDDWLGDDLKRRILREAADLEDVLKARGLRYWRFANPDVVTYDPATSAWRFYEVKLPGDDVRENQRKSLELLQRLVPASLAAIVVLNPE